MRKTGKDHDENQEENWADFIDRLQPFEPPTFRTRLAAARLAHASPASANTTADDARPADVRTSPFPKDRWSSR